MSLPGCKPIVRLHRLFRRQVVSYWAVMWSYPTKLLPVLSVNLLGVSGLPLVSSSGACFVKRQLCSALVIAMHRRTSLQHASSGGITRSHHARVLVDRQIMNVRRQGNEHTIHTR